MSDSDAILKSGLDHHRAGDLAAAKRLYHALLAQNPDHADATQLLGLVAYQSGQLDLAAALVDHALRLQPATPVYLYNRGRIAAAREESLSALAFFAEAAAVAPGYDDARGALAQTLAALGRTDSVDAVIADRVAARSHAGYQAQIESMRRGPYMDFPSHVHLETFAQCNAACGFCPYPDLERKGEKMSDDLVAKVIGDLADIPRGLGFQLSPFKVSEPFLDPRLFDILGDINNRLPNATLALTTNGTPVTAKTLARLSGVKNLRYLWVSFNDHRKAEYEATMRLPYRKTIERLDLIHQWRADERLATRVVLSRVGDGTADDQAFRDWIAERYPAFESAVTPRGDWIGKVEAGAPPLPPVGCARWFELSITATGVVAHCCMDGHADFPIGDVRETHALEIYNAPEYRKLRERTRVRSEVSPCNACSFT